MYCYIIIYYSFYILYISDASPASISSHAGPPSTSHTAVTLRKAISNMKNNYKLQTQFMNTII